MNHSLLGYDLTGFIDGAASTVTGNIQGWMLLLAMVTVIICCRCRPVCPALLEHRGEVQIVSITLTITTGGGEGGTDDPRVC